MTARTYCTCRTPLSLRTGSHKMRKQNRALVVIGGGTLSYLPKRWTMRPTGDWLASRAAILDTVRYVRERILSFFTSFTKKKKNQSIAPLPFVRWPVANNISPRNATKRNEKYQTISSTCTKQKRVAGDLEALLLPVHSVVPAAPITLRPGQRRGVEGHWHHDDMTPTTTAPQQKNMFTSLPTTFL